MTYLSGAQKYIHWHVFIITWANAIVIALMIVIFVLALYLPYPGSGRPAPVDGEDEEGGA